MGSESTVRQCSLEKRRDGTVGVDALVGNIDSQVSENLFQLFDGAFSCVALGNANKSDLVKIKLDRGLGELIPEHLLPNRVELNPKAVKIPHASRSFRSIYGVNKTVLSRFPRWQLSCWARPGMRPSTGVGRGRVPTDGSSFYWGWSGGLYVTLGYFDFRQRVW